MPIFEQLTGSLLDHELGTADTSVLFTSTRRAAAINEAALEFADLTECFLRQSSVTCSCNTAEYDLNSSAILSTDFIRFAVQGAEYHFRSSGAAGQLQVMAGDDFPRRDIEWLNRYEPGWRESTTPVELPTSYYLRADGGQWIVGLSNRPDIGSSETGTLLLPFVARPPAMTSSGDLPYTLNGQVRYDLVPFHRGLVHWAAHQLEKLRGDTEASDRQYAKFLGYVQRFTEKARPKGGGVITMARNYFREVVGPRSGVDQRGLDPRRDFV